ncbi:CLUMA_CG014575, isoform A [Clunio marinus]|uniref:CLUMA_CG014575, isoform A n=1 Tax=Clunio marinus TaxID=568069 RepID=A0A1J1ILE6_9DIPT|nr:CLUMA_CG014575, isoform A [Clunio marinus]
MRWKPHIYPIVQQLSMKFKEFLSFENFKKHREIQLTYFCSFFNKEQRIEIYFKCAWVNCRIMLERHQEYCCGRYHGKGKNTELKIPTTKFPAKALKF